MSVWKSDEKLLSFTSLISPWKSFCLRSNICHSTQCFNLEVREKHSAARCIFNSLLSVSSCDEVGGGRWDYSIPHPAFAPPHSCCERLVHTAHVWSVAGIRLLYPSRRVPCRRRRFAYPLKLPYVQDVLLSIWWDAGNLNAVCFTLDTTETRSKV